MSTQSRDHLQAVGRQLIAARTDLGLSRAQVARGAGLADKTLARLEAGDEVRLSTYLAVIHYFATREPNVAGATERLTRLSAHARRRLLELLERFEAMEDRG